MSVRCGTKWQFTGGMNGEYDGCGSIHPAKGFFDAWADCYDLDYEALEIGDVQFYVELAREADGPVLEVSCGTGRIHLELLRAGVDAYGIDVSAETVWIVEK